MTFPAAVPGSEGSICGGGSSGGITQGLAVGIF